MSIFSETFKDFVFKQLRIRETIVKQGNAIKSPTKFASRFGSPKLNIGTEEKPKYLNIDKGAFYTNSVSKQCVIRMSSGVDITSDVLLEEGEKEDLIDEGLAKRYILEGGILDEDEKPRGKDFNNFAKKGGAYGDSFLRSDAKDGFGIVPMPGIVDATIRTKSAYGSLREAKVNFVCHNRRQLDVLEMLYMRPGFPILLEWQWSPFINNDGKIDNNVYGVGDDWWDQKKNINNFNLKVINQKDKSGGNYDGFVGFCKNFEIKARPDGGYDCTTELIAAGEILEGLKARNDGGTYKKEKEDTSADNFELMLRNIIDVDEYISEGNKITNPAFDPDSQYQESPYYIWRSSDMNIQSIQDTYVRWDMLCNLINDTCFPLTESNNPLLKLTYTQSKKGKYDENPNKVVAQYGRKGQKIVNEKYIEFVPFKFEKKSHLDNITYEQRRVGNKLFTNTFITIVPTVAEGTKINMEETLNNSFNPSICLLPKQTHHYHHHLTKNYIGHIMLNVDHLLEVYRQMAYSGDKPAKDFNLFDYLTRIWSDVSRACGGHHNFILQVELERPDRVRVIDFQTGKVNVSPQDLFEFKIQGNNSIVRDFNFNTTIPGSLSATIAIAAQAPSSVSDLDQVTFANFSKGIKNRFTGTKELSEKEKNIEKQIKEKAKGDYKGDLNLYKYLSTKLYVYLEVILNGAQKHSIRVNKVDHDNAVNLAASVEALLYSLLSRKRGTGEKQHTILARRSAVIPLKFNAKMDGIGGIVIGHVFKVEKEKLPKGYQSDDVAFVVLGESQNITSGQDWTTEISGQLMLLDLLQYDFSYNQEVGTAKSDMDLWKKVDENRPSDLPPSENPYTLDNFA